MSKSTPAESPDTSSENARKSTETLGLVAKENLEAFLFAVILVVIVRHFSLTPFRIPSSSMEPTLMGHEGANDRLFVNRWIYGLQPPRRWDVIVFLYPLNQDKHFIKRLVGLPGEAIGIADGDVYIDGAIQRKPKAVQEALWLEVSHPGDAKGLEKWTARDGQVAHEDGAVQLRPSAEGPAWVGYGQFDPEGGQVGDTRIYNSYLRGESSEPVGPGNGLGGDSIRLVGDLRLRGTLTGGQGTKRLRAQLVSGLDRFELEIGVADGVASRLVHRRTGKELSVKALDGVRARAGSGLAVAIWFVDRQLVVSIDGREVATLDLARPLADVRFDTEQAWAAFGVEGGPLTIDDLELDRDVYYTNAGLLARDHGHPPRSLSIPAGRYFVLGDNSANSSDSRLWKIERVTLRDGRVINHEFQPGGDRERTEQIVHSSGTLIPVEPLNVDPPGTPPDQQRRILDEYGVWRYFKFGDIQSRKRLGHGEAEYDPDYQTVARELVIGRAFLIFWPLPPAGSWRIGFIR